MLVGRAATKRTKKLRCLQVANESFTAFRFLLPIACYLRENGIDTEIACSDYRYSDAGDFIAQIQARGIRWRRLQIRREVAPLADLWSFIRAFLFFLTHRYDIVHTQTSKAGFICRVAARLAGVPVVVHYSFDYAFSDQGTLHDRIFIWCERMAGRFCDRVYFIADTEMERGMKHGIVPKEKVLMTGPVGIDLEEMDPGRIVPERVSAVRDKYHIPDERRVVGTITRLVPHKGVVTLLHAIEILTKRFPDVVCVIVGGGPEKGALRDEAERCGIADRVIFTGFVESQEDIAPLFLTFDAFCLPTKKEGFGIVFAEAGALGKPVVGCNIGPINQIIVDGVTGFLCPPDDATAFAEAIGRLLSDPVLNRRCGLAGRRRSEEVFDSKIAYEKVKRDYLRILKDKRRKIPGNA
jgi:glycosyltransferase involved in cell wall biosynthesis